jgi:hypothetical protein
VLLEPVLPQADPCTDIEHAFQLDPIPAREADYETRKVSVLFGTDDARLRGFVEAVVVRFIEPTEPIHIRQSNSKGRAQRDGLAEALLSSGWSHGSYPYENIGYK